MKLKFTDPDGLLSENNVEFVRRRLLFALSRFDSKVDTAVITVRDCNGPRGGIDKHCSLRVILRSGQELFVSDQDETVEQCLARVSERMGRTIARQLERQQDRYRRQSDSLSRLFQ